MKVVEDGSAAPPNHSVILSGGGASPPESKDPYLAGSRYRSLNLRLV